MPTAELDTIALALCVVLFGLGVLIVARRERTLAQADRAMLRSLGTDLGVLAAGVLGGVALFLADRKPLVSIAVAVAAYGLWIVRVPYRISKQSWPTSTQQQLMLGYALPASGCLIYVMIRAAQHV